ncbi:MAG: hypothetical protein ACR2IE_05135 [Candidatus Sumerlaeaceae bacterium]
MSARQTFAYVLIVPTFGFFLGAFFGIFCLYAMAGLGPVPVDHERLNNSSLGAMLLGICIGVFANVLFAALLSPTWRTRVFVTEAMLMLLLMIVTVLGVSIG